MIPKMLSMASCSRPSLFLVRHRSVLGGTRSSLLQSAPFLICPPIAVSSFARVFYSSPSCRSSPQSSSITVCRAASSKAMATRNDVERLIQHLLVPEDQLSLLLDLQRETQRGSDLSDLAFEHSICPSKENGGMLGWVRKGQMVPEFEEAAFTASLNKIVRVKTKFGWHLVQALSEREATFLKDIQPEELHSLLQDSGFINEAQLIDVREPNEVSVAAIEGFKAYPLSQFGKWGPQIASDLDTSRDTYVLCHHGVRSLQAAQWLQTQGFQRLYNVAGGIHQYSMKANKDIPTY